MLAAGASYIGERLPADGTPADQLRAYVAANVPQASFLVHVDGPCGSGKSTLLDFLQEELTPRWLVVRYDAWRQVAWEWAFLIFWSHTILPVLEFGKWLERRGVFERETRNVATNQA